MAKTKRDVPDKAQISNLGWVPQPWQNLQPDTTEKVKKLSAEDLMKLYKEYDILRQDASDVKDLKSGISWFRDLDVSNIKRLRDRADIDKKEFRSLIHKMVAKKGEESDVGGLDNWATRQAINLALSQKGLRQGGFHPTQY